MALSTMETFAKWFRHICAVLFLILGVYLTIHCILEANGHDHCCGHDHCDHEHYELSL